MKSLVGICLLLGLCGCGYHFSDQAGSFPAGVKTVYLPLFVNQTSEPLLENRLGNDVGEVLARNGKISLVENRDRAEAVLEGIIRSYTSRPLSYDRHDAISEYRVAMVVNCKLRRLVDGRLLWQGTLSQDGEYLAAADKTLQEDLEQQAIEEISRRLAEELSYRLLVDF